MVNIKRDRNAYCKQFGKYRLNRRDFLAIEKILWVYADAREMKNAGVNKPPEGRKHMPRRGVDRHASIGRYRPFHVSFGWNEFGIHFAGVDWIYQEDSVKYLAKPEYPQRISYLELSAWPGIKVTFTPLSTTIYAQTNYATGNELRVMRSCVANIEHYLSKCKRSLVINRINLS